MLIWLFVIACVEVIGLIKLGQVIGGGAVIGLILLTAVLGWALLRLGGGTALSGLVLNLFSGRLSIRRLLCQRELALLLAGVFLIVPGVLTDLLGLGLLARYAVTKPPPPHSRGKERDVIDVEYHIHDEVPRE